MLEMDFNNIAKTYRESTPKIPKGYLNKIIQIGNLQENSLLLEYGCGSGEIAISLAEKGISVIGVDSSSNQIRKAKTSKKKNKIKWVLAKAEEYIPKKKVDMIFSYESFHLFDMPLVIKKTKEILNKDGTFCIGYCNYHWENDFKEIIIEHISKYNFEWNEWSCPDFYRLLKNERNSFIKYNTECIKVYEEADISTIANFLISISPLYKINQINLKSMRKKLQNRMWEKKKKKIIRGETTYFLKYTRAI